MFELKTSLGLNQALSLTPELRQSLEILAMSDLEISALMSEELVDNVALSECDDEAQEPDSWSVDIQDQEMASIPTLAERLRRQLYEGDFNILEKEIGERLIGELDESGYFVGSIEEISHELLIPNSWVNSVRRRMLLLEPAGCLALDLQECLLAQLLAENAHPNQILLKILRGGYLEKSISNPSQIAKKLGFSKADLQEALNLLVRFKAKPGECNDLSSWPPIQLMLPQVEVIRIGGQLRVNPLRFNKRRFYVKKTAIEETVKTKNENVVSFVKHKERRASWLLSALERREQTIVRVIQSLVKFQEKWFLCEAPLIPLTMKQVAIDLQLHESTVSRAVANKFLRCDRGILNVRGFFTSRISSESEEPVSSDSAKSAIRKLIALENPLSPLSDQSICEQLRADQFRISRRTVSKYRHQLKISPGYMRKHN